MGAGLAVGTAIARFAGVEVAALATAGARVRAGAEPE
jgi:hypothetical protein